MPQSKPTSSTPWYLKPLSNCPKCGAPVAEDDTICSKCGYVLQPQQPTVTPPTQSPTPWHTSQPPPQWPTQQPSRGIRGSYFMYGIISAFASLFFVSEIFGAAAIILGAYTWKREQGNRGLYVLIFGIICMLVGIYFTAYPLLIDLLLPS